MLGMSAGDIITVMVFVAGLIINAVVYLLAVRSQLQLIAHKQTSMEEDLTQIAAETQNDVKNLAQVVVLQSRHDERITSLQLTVVNQGKRLDNAIERMNTYLDLRGAPEGDD